MKIDYDYLKQMINTMEAMETPEFSNIQIFDKIHPEASELEDSDYDAYLQLTDVYVFHVYLLDDQELISTKSDVRAGIELFSGRYNLHRKKIRLTKEGHEFLIALNDDTTFNKIKKNAGKITFGAVKIAAIALAEATATSLLS